MNDAKSTQPLFELFLNENEKIRYELREGISSVINKLQRIHNYSPKEIKNESIAKEPVSYFDKLEAINSDLATMRLALSYINDHLDIIV